MYKVFKRCNVVSFKHMTVPKYIGICEGFDEKPMRLIRHYLTKLYYFLINLTPDAKVIT